MKLVIASLFALPLLSGCLVAAGAGAVIGTAGAAIGAGVDLVTTSKDEQNAKDVKKLRKENEELKKQQKG